MTRDELAELVYQKSDDLPSKNGARRVVALVFEEIKKAMKDETVSIYHFGHFSTKVRSARSGRNPRTGEAINIPAKRVPKFKASNPLKDFVAE